MKSTVTLTDTTSSTCTKILKTSDFCISPTFYIHVTCIVIDFFLNSQPDALIIPILFCYKNLHVSGIFSVHHQGFSTVYSAMVSFMQVSDDRFQTSSSILTLLGRGHQKTARNLPLPNIQ